MDMDQSSNRMLQKSSYIRYLLIREFFFIHLFSRTTKNLLFLNIHVRKLDKNVYFAYIDLC